MGRFAPACLLPVVGLVALALAAAAPRVGADGHLTTGPECEIQGLAEYVIENVQYGACSEAVYVRACREAQLQHRERCREFCGALQQLGTRRSCVGRSSPVAELFHPKRHCDEIQHERFDVSCRVRAECACQGHGLQSS
ncbi:MAG: hypothetical protein JSU66_17015 [Deltaproteobacteria bacterium]|nr:MAG: hypothetical protein JSU66_17015 [Deltaproteobacteria bacterium]